MKVKGSTLFYDTDKLNLKDAPCENCKKDGCSWGNCSPWTNWKSCPPHQRYAPIKTCDALCPMKIQCYEATKAACNQTKRLKSVAATFHDNHLQCTFDVGPDTPPETIEDLGRLFFSTDLENNSTHPQYRDYVKMMNEYCSVVVEDGCFPDPSDSSPKRTSCTRLQQKGKAGDLCRKWYTTLSSTDRDQFMKKVCQIHQRDLYECDCVNRALDPDYALFSSVGNDGCWWKPCKISPPYLIPSDVHSQNCPNVCQTIQVMKAQGNIQINGPLQQKIACSNIFTPPQDSPRDGGDGGGGGGGNQKPTHPSISWVKVVIAILFVIFIIVFTIIIMVKWHHNDDRKHGSSSTKK